MIPSRLLPGNGLQRPMTARSEFVCVSMMVMIVEAAIKASRSNGKVEKMANVSAKDYNSMFIYVSLVPMLGSSQSMRACKMLHRRNSWRLGDKGSISQDK